MFVLFEDSCLKITGHDVYHYLSAFLCILSMGRLIKKVGRDVMYRDFALFIVLFFNCIWVYFIVRSGSGPWAFRGQLASLNETHTC